MPVSHALTGRRSSPVALPVFLLLLCLGLTAATPVPDPDYRPEPTIRSTGLMRVYAVMVEFQPDDNRFTSGDGTFNPEYLANPDIPVTIGPLPHDAGYFGAHLDFMKEYFRRVSDGKLQIEWQIHPDVIRLSQKMETYTPMGEGNDENYKLVDFAEEAWQAVAQSGHFNPEGFDEDRDAFIIFHAGAGRDINFLGSALTPTPQDLPSLYMGLDAMQRFRNDFAFNGFDVGTAGKSFRIKNTLILPETESRPGRDVTDQPFLLQLGINGLLCATMGNHIGLPDLYNTNDGGSGIGRFGLMDGAGFFSYFGMFPPEPSAWEKLRLGWIEPIDIDINAIATIQLPAVSLRQPGSVARIRISQDEYFLIENRHRDPENDGITLKIRTPEGHIVEKHLTMFDDLFSSTSADSLSKVLPAGVVVDVDNYDWSLPGGVDAGDDQEIGTDDDRLLNGGILIWHVDEAVLRAGNYRGGVNNNPLRRGVRLVEADGSQDIGVKTSNQFLSGFVNGTAFDFWWSGNDSRVITTTNQTIQLYQNRFGADTRPANRSNTGAINPFELFDFSDNEVVASFKIRPVLAEGIEAIPMPVDLPSSLVNTEVHVKGYSLGLSMFDNGTDQMLLIPHSDGVISVPVGNTGEVQHLYGPFPHQPFVMGSDLFVAQNAAFGPMQNGPTMFTFENGRFQLKWQNNTAGISVSFPNISNQTVDLAGTSTRLNRVNGQVETSYPEAVQWTNSAGGNRYGINRTHIFSENGNVSIPIPAQTDDTERRYLMRYPVSDQAVLLIEPRKITGYSDENATGTEYFSGSDFGWPALFDADSDGRYDVIVVNRSLNQLEAKNSRGASLDGFPIKPPKGLRFTGTPLSVYLDENTATPATIIAAADSLSLVLLGYDENRKMLPGFPLYVGSLTATNDEPLNPLYHNQHLYAVSPAGELKAWRFAEAGRAAWPTIYGTFLQGHPAGILFNDEPEPSGNQQLLVSEETYNWPNPADAETHLRFMTSAHAQIDIVIISQDGKPVFNTTAQTIPNVPQEILIPTASMGNGVYLARIRAVSDGREASKIVKIAVIH